MTVLSKPLANRLFNSSAIANAAIAIIFQYYGDMMKRRRRRIRSAPYPRIRITFQEVFAQLGPVNFRRAFRMTHDSFWRLFYILSPYIDEATQKGNRFQSKGVRGDCYLPPLFPMVPSWQVHALHALFGTLLEDRLTTSCLHLVFRTGKF